MKEAYERVILVVAIGLLLLSFLSYQSSEQTGYTTASDEHRYTCLDADDALSHLRNNLYNKRYDLNLDGTLDNNDISMLIQESRKHPCPKAYDCTREGDTRCGFSGSLLTCTRTSENLLLWKEMKCGGGQRCTSSTKPTALPSGARGPSRTTASCAYTFKG